MRSGQFYAMAVGGNGCPLCGRREAHGHSTNEALALMRSHRDTDRSGEAGQTAKQAGPVGREPGPSEETASPND